MKRTIILSLLCLITLGSWAQERKLYDFVVPRDGSFRQAIEAANNRKDTNERFRIFIMQGDYQIPTEGITKGGDGKEYGDPRTWLKAPNTSIIGEGRDNTILTNTTPPATWHNGFNEACPLEGIGKGDVLIIDKQVSSTYLQDLTMKNGMGDHTGRNIVLNDNGDLTIAKNVCMWGYQDTYVSHNKRSRYYFEGGIIRGRTDYICGKGDVYYNKVTFQQCGEGGYLAVPSDPRKYGYIMESCYIKSETPDVTYYLGRPWGKGTPTAIWLNTKVDAAPITKDKNNYNGWADMSGGWPARFAEYNTMLTTGEKLSLEGRRSQWTDREGVTHDNKPVLTDFEASQYTLQNVLDGWNPTKDTKQMTAPKNVRINKGVLSWAEQEGALLYAVCRNGKVVDFTTACSYKLKGAKKDDVWSVRAANQMGGLGPETIVGAPETYTNPILGGDYPDPTIMREGNDYYMTHSAFDYQPGLTVFHSTDLVNWEPISYALKTYLGSVWAPDICKYKDKYYIYFTVAHPSGRKNFVVWATSPYGPWSDPIDLKIGNIDPCHIVGEDGTRWMFMSAGKRVRLTDDGLAIVPGTEETVYPGWQYPEEWLTEGLCLEGPKLRKIGEYYYYLNAEGGTAGPPTSHMVVVARSKSINGPWEDSPYNPLVHTYKESDRWWSKGHGSLIDTPDGKWMIVYHSYENGYYNLGRQTLMEPVEMTEDGWFRTLPSTDIEGEIKAPLPLSNPIDRKARLGEFRLGLDWKFYKAFNPERISVKDGVLTMQGKGTTANESSPLMCVAGDHAYEIEAEIELHGEVSAGMLLIYNSQFFQGIGFDGKSRYRYRMGGRSGRAPSGGNHLWLRLRNDNHIVTGEYSTDGIEWHRETWGMDISGYHHNTLYEFQSVLPSLFVTGNGYAKFKNFKYTKLDE